MKESYWMKTKNRNNKIENLDPLIIINQEPNVFLNAQVLFLNNQFIF